MIDLKYNDIIDRLDSVNKTTGSVGFQIILLSKKIENLTNHLKQFTRDVHSKRGLIAAVNKRKKLLTFIKVKNEEEYLSIISILALRK
jgi:small subunit ribosomal protein S15